MSDCTRVGIEFMLVAVYGRVSTVHIEQESSYENQYNYFNNKIDNERIHVIFTVALII